MSDGAAAGTVETATLFAGRLSLVQLVKGHRAGTDAVLLAAAAGPRRGERFVDVGAGSGAVGLWLGLQEPQAQGVLLETDPASADLARANAVTNGLAGRIDIAELDLFDAQGCRAAGLAGSADLVVSNPPFYRAGTIRVSPDAGRARAHVLRTAEPEPHAAWIGRCVDLLAPKGRLLVIHRPEALPALLQRLDRRLGGLRILPIYAKRGGTAVRVLLGGIAGSRAPLELLPGLVLHDADGAFTSEAARLHDGEALPFWHPGLGLRRKSVARA